MRVVVLTKTEMDALETGTATPAVQERAVACIKFLTDKLEEARRPPRGNY